MKLHQLLALTGLTVTGLTFVACGKNYEAAPPAVEPAPASHAPAGHAAEEQEAEPPDQLEQGDSGKAETAAPEEDSMDRAEAMPSGSASVTALNVELEHFDQHMKPAELSCHGAKPHLEAICDIAKRICESSDLLKPNSDCQAAQSSCDKARARFRVKCLD